mmetsp:Transcript_62476/g.167562  ORF Transcript_62476/g.167562 Transcript_62476/m.167562 type:complete len:88 (-) Transcript_62476:84-347(-)
MNGLFRFREIIVPAEAGFLRQAAGVGGLSFCVGASMETFMIFTGFYEVATRKEAERRALEMAAREEQARIRRERREQREKEKASGGH